MGGRDTPAGRLKGLGNVKEKTLSRRVSQRCSLVVCRMLVSSFFLHVFIWCSVFAFVRVIIRVVGSGDDDGGVLCSLASCASANLICCVFLCLLGERGDYSRSFRDGGRNV